MHDLDIQSQVPGTKSRQLILQAADLPVEQSRTAEPTLAFEGRRLHSGVDPRAEAHQWMQEQGHVLLEALRADPENRVVVLAGPALGYCVIALEQFLEKEGLDTARFEVHCLEAVPEIAKAALRLRVWNDSKLKFRWHILTDKNDLRELLPSTENYIALKGSAGYHIRSDVYDIALPERKHNSQSTPLRILVPTPMYGGSVPAAIHSANALRELGHDVELLDLTSYYESYQRIESLSKRREYTDRLKGMFASFLGECIVARAIEFKADLVWSVAQTPLTPLALQELRQNKITTALWFVENFRLFNSWREIAPSYDAVFTIQKGEFHRQLRELGVRNISYLPCASDPAAHQEIELSMSERARYGSEVSFVGAGYMNRVQTFTKLNLRNLKIWGSDWPEQGTVTRWIQEKGRRVTTDETCKIFGATTVNLNLHSSTAHTGVNPGGDFVNPRTFEIASCGAFQLVDRREYLPELFVEGKEVVVFDHIEDIPFLIEKYLRDESARTEIAANARVRVLSEHTYAHRMNSALHFLSNHCSQLSERLRSKTTYASLKDAVNDDSEMIEFLNQFDPGQEVDLDYVASRVQLGKGKLSRPEGIFLLMKEFRDWGLEKGVIS
jgi:spore maturation protein CgeB